VPVDIGKGMDRGACATTQTGYRFTVPLSLKTIGAKSQCYREPISNPVGAMHKLAVAPAVFRTAPEASPMRCVVS